MKDFKKVDELILNITKQIFKRHDKNILIILDNWKYLVGNDLHTICYPIKINRFDVLIVRVQSAYLIELQYKTDELIKKINALLKSKTICKIKLMITYK